MTFENLSNKDSRFGQTGNIAAADSEKNSRVFIGYKDVLGQSMKAEHPSIKDSVKRGLNELWHSSDRVECNLDGQTEQMSFDEYLETMGIKYGDYFKKIKESTDKNFSQQEILFELQAGFINQRTRQAIKKMQEYTSERPDRDNLQQETARAHSPLFNKIINDLGIDGLSAEASSLCHDYFDEIDEWLVLNPEALNSQGEETGHNFFIGIQRSFKPKKLKSRVIMLPEEPSRGPIFKVFIQEELNEYIDNPNDRKNAESYWQKLLNIRTERARAVGMDPNEYAKIKAGQGLPSVDKVLPGGRQQQIEKTRQVLLAVKQQFSGYLSSDDFSQQSSRTRRILEQNYRALGMDNFLSSLEETEL